ISSAGRRRNGPKTFTAAGSAGGVDGRRQEGRYLPKVAAEGSALPDPACVEGQAPLLCAPRQQRGPRFSCASFWRPPAEAVAFGRPSFRRRRKPAVEVIEDRFDGRPQLIGDLILAL